MTSYPHAGIRLRLITGNQMIGEGALHAGCRFFAGYPIMPASGICRSMIELLRQRGDVAFSAQDEISALTSCVGASIQGHKAMTPTFGPGRALMTETSVVSALVQRLGPSTGGGSLTSYRR